MNSELTHKDKTAFANKRAAQQVTDYTDFTHIDMPASERAKLDVGDIYMNVAKHTVCGWIIRSKNRHDYNSCLCGDLSIDGGSWYQTLTGDIAHAESHIVYYKEKHRDEDD